MVTATGFRARRSVGNGVLRLHEHQRSQWIEATPDPIPSTTADRRASLEAWQRARLQSTVTIQPSDGVNIHSPPRLYREDVGLSCTGEKPDDRR